MQRILPLSPPLRVRHVLEYSLGATYRAVMCARVRCCCRAVDAASGQGYADVLRRCPNHKHVTIAYAEYQQALRVPVSEDSELSPVRRYREGDARQLEYVVVMEYAPLGTVDTYTYRSSDELCRGFSC